MSSWSYHQPLMVDESQEPLYVAYQPWFMPEGGQKYAVTRSQYEFLKANASLAGRKEITPFQARVTEFTFLCYGWTWADDAKRNDRYRTIQEQVSRALLGKAYGAWKEDEE